MSKDTYLEPMCIQCGKPAYQFRGKTYKLCATCGWGALVRLMGYVDDSPITDQEKLDKVVDYVPYSEWSKG